jgi:hypothetical protein
MDEKEVPVDEQWRQIGDIIAFHSGIGWGNVTFRIENGRFSGLIEVRETLKVKD